MTAVSIAYAYHFRHVLAAVFAVATVALLVRRIRADRDLGRLADDLAELIGR